MNTWKTPHSLGALDKKAKAAEEWIQVANWGWTVNNEAELYKDTCCYLWNLIVNTEYFSSILQTRLPSQATHFQLMDSCSSDSVCESDSHRAGIEVKGWKPAMLADLLQGRSRSNCCHPNMLTTYRGGRLWQGDTWGLFSPGHALQELWDFLEVL